jgi:hypothetical protein
MTTPPSNWTAMIEVYETGQLKLNAVHSKQTSYPEIDLACLESLHVWMVHDGRVRLKQEG